MSDAMKMTVDLVAFDETTASPETLARVRLFRASPKMLAVLERYVSSYGHEDECASVRATNDDDCDCLYGQAQDLVEEVRGT